MEGTGKKKTYANDKLSTHLEKKGNSSHIIESKREKGNKDSSNSKNDYSITKNYKNLIKSTKHEKNRFEYLKERLEETLQKKNALILKIKKGDTKLNLLRGEKVSYDRSKNELEMKLNELNECSRMKKNEYYQLLANAKKMGKSLEDIVNEKKIVEDEFNEWINDKSDTHAEISHERMQLMKMRKRKQELIKQLLILVKREDNKYYNMNHLETVENKLNEEVNSYKFYKTEDLQTAMELTDVNPS